MATNFSGISISTKLHTMGLRLDDFYEDLERNCWIEKSTGRPIDLRTGNYLDTDSNESIIEKPITFHYTHITPEQAEQITDSHDLEKTVKTFMNSNPGHARWIAIAITHIEQAFMAYRRSVGGTKDD